jgi:transcriptional regulator with XRE-family HTH domain
MADEWRALLRKARREMGITVPQAAGRAGISPETVRAYEGGRRKPSRTHLLALVRGLQVNAANGNAILERAGFAPERTLFPADRFPAFYFRAGETQAEVDRVPWPAFASNDLSEVVAANTAVQALWDIDWKHELRARTAAGRNLLAVASDHHFADRVVNWDECVGVIAAVTKGRPHLPEQIEQPSDYLNQVLAEFARGDAAFLARLIEVWAATPPAEAKVRWGYPVVWSDADFGEMRFQAIVSQASEPDALGFNDWHPVDADTWQVLERVKARHAAKHARTSR